MTTQKSLLKPNLVWKLLLDFYAIFIFSFLLSNLNSKRLVLIQSKHDFGLAVINNVKYKVPYTVQETVIPIHVDNPVDFLFISTTEFNECFAGMAIKLALYILLLIGSFEPDDPYNYRLEIIYKAVFYLVFALICSEIFKYVATSNWVQNPSHGLSGYQYKNNAFIGSYSIPLLAVASLIFYRSNWRQTRINFD